MRYLALIAILFVAACSKKDDDGGSTTSTKETYVNVSFNNDLNREYHIDVYLTKDDYKNSRNADLSITLKPNESYKTTFRNHDTIHYVDVYSDDYTAGNWGQVTPRVVPLKTTDDPLFINFNYKVPIFPTEKEFQVNLSDNFNPTAKWMREVMIDGNKPEVVWKAIWSNDWSTRTEEQKYHKLTLAKDLSAVYERKEGGEIKQYTGTYYTDISLQEDLSKANTMPMYINDFGNKLTGLQKYGVGKDSLMVTTNNPYATIIFVKE